MKRVSSLLFTLLLAACASHSDIKARSTALNTPARFQVIDTRCWEAFADSQLNSLVTQAISTSPGMAQAQARVRLTQALQQLQGADLSPQISAAGSAQRQRISQNGMIPPPFAGKTVNLEQIGLNFSYDFDFWNRNRKALKAALTDTREAEAEKTAARLILAAAVMDAYFGLQQDFAQQDLARTSLQKRQERLRLAQIREQQGLDNILTVNGEENKVADRKLNLAELDKDISLRKNELAALLGKPDTAIEVAPVRVQLPRLPEQLPADALGFRPDILALRLKIEAGESRADAARAEFYPNINLSAFAGFQSLSLGTLINGSSFMAQAGPALNLPIYGGGRLRANLSAREAEVDIAIERYNQGVIQAMREVADAKSALDALTTEIGEQNEAVVASESALQLSASRYRQGLTDIGPLLDAEIFSIEQKNRLDELEGRRLRLFVALLRAFGGHSFPEKS